MDNPTTIISQNIINVDIDSRAVTLPVNFNLGVMNDNSCKTITFMVQKKSDITDLTDLTFSVNTISAKETPDKLECDCREEGGFYIITALLKGTIFEASGKAVFNLCGQKFDSSHAVIKSWGSEDITALVGSHSHAEKSIEELYPSVLEELRQKVNNPNLTDEQLNNIATKVAEKGFYTKSEIDSMIANIDVDLSSYQTKTDDTLTTTSKEVVGAINENTSNISELKSDLTHKIDKPTTEDNNKFPRAKDGNVEWVEQGLPTDEQTASAVANWLNAHPEATIVEDGSITEKKLADNSVTPSKIKPSSINVSKLHGSYEYAGHSSVDVVIKGKSLNSSTGAIIERPGYYLSNDISVNGYNYLALGNLSSILACFYDSNGDFISSCTGDRFHYTSNSIPGNAKTVRITNDNKLIKAVLTNYSFNISESQYLLSSGIFANPKSVNYGKFNVDRDIPKNFPDSSVPMTAIEGLNAKRYNYLTDRVDFFGENLNLLPILDTYYVYHFASGATAGQSGKIIKIYEDGYVQEGKFDGFGYDYVGYTAITVSMPNDGTHGSCLYAYGVANFVPVLSDSKVTVISDRDDLTEYHSYDEMYFEPSDNFKSLVKSSQESKVKVYNGGLMITLGDSYTAFASTFFDSFASKHGLIQKNVGLASSKIARPEGEGQDTIKSFVTRLDELISSFPLTIDDKQYTLSDVKLITFMGGANDWTTVDASENIDRIGNKYSTDVGQLYGACKYIFGKLLSTFPTSDIIAILQPNNSKSGGINLAEMWTKETVVKECAEMYSLPICDCCFDFYSPANPNELSKYWQSDKLHLTHDGNAELFKKLESTLNTLSYYKSK